jgi:hypothetical protein
VIYEAITPNRCPLSPYRAGAWISGQGADRVLSLWSEDLTTGTRTLQHFPWREGEPLPHAQEPFRYRVVLTEGDAPPRDAILWQTPPTTRET